MENIETFKICNSGGAIGADTLFEDICVNNGIDVIAWSFKGHKTDSKNTVILSQEELIEGFEHVKIANKNLKRNIFNIGPYVKKLLSRNWYQVKNSDAIYAIANIKSDYMSVEGGTGWAIQMAIDNKKSIFVFDQKTDLWFEYDYIIGFKPMGIGDIPKLTERFAGIGTRELKDSGIVAIKSLFKKNKK